MECALPLGEEENGSILAPNTNLNKHQQIASVGASAADELEELLAQPCNILMLISDHMSSIHVCTVHQFHFVPFHSILGFKHSPKPGGDGKVAVCY